jgi:hypothetical protein
VVGKKRNKKVEGRLIEYGMNRPSCLVADTSRPPMLQKRLHATALDKHVCED